jgi:hypothetical protein
MEQSNPGMLISLRLFLEGIEIPVISASVTATVGSPASASIEIIPDSKAELLLPRTVVHLFFLDYAEFSRSSRTAPTLSDYKLLFCGELFTLSENKMGAGSRAVTLSCLDFSNILDTSFTYQFQAGNPDTSLLKNTSTFLATPDLTFDTIINSPSEVIRSLANAAPVSPASTGQGSILGGLLSIIEYLVGIQGNYYGVNAWTTVHERRTRLIESIVADTGETAAKVFEATQFSDWLMSRIGAEGDVISFRRLVDIILSATFYSWVPCPTAKYVAGQSVDFPGLPNRDIPTITTISEEGSADVGDLSSFTRSGSARLSLQKSFVDLVTPFLAAVDSKLQARSLASKRPAKVYITSAYREPEDGEEARTAHQRGLAIDFRFEYTDNIPNKSAPNLGNVAMPFLTCASLDKQIQPPMGGSWYLRLRAAIFELSKNGATSVDLITIKAVIQSVPTAFIVFNNDERTLDNDLEVANDWKSFGAIVRAVAPTTLTVMPTFSGRPDRNNRIDPVFSSLLDIGNDPVHVQPANLLSQLRTADTADAATVAIPAKPSFTRERLHSFILRPDVWFAAPPRCNVIFPDVLQSFSMQRDMLRETSRLQLDVGFEFSPDSSSTTRLVFAPQFLNRESLTEGPLNSADKNMIYDHEKFSGVVPKFDRMIDTLFFIEKDASIPATEESTLADLGNYPDKIAHSNLLNERYLARSANASLAFSPQIVCGFPAVVVDAVITSVEAGSKDFSLKNRSFKIGMVRSISHSISQGGAQTQVQLTHVRSHRAGDGTDDIFTELIGNDGTLTLQDTTQPPALQAGKALFVIGTVKAKIFDDYESADEFGWRGISNLFQFGTIEGLIDATPTVVMSSTDIWNPSLIVSSPSSVTADASAFTGLVAFEQIPYRNATINTGSWSGSPTRVFIHVVINGDRKTISVAAVPPPAFAGMAANDTLLQQPVTKYRREADIIEEVICLNLPGNTFTAELPESAIQSKKLLPVEETLRPIWISESYSNTNITTQIYEPFLGTRAIVDGLKPSKFSVPSIEEAVDRLVIEYSREVSSSGISPLDWVHAYTHRDIANYHQVLGSKLQKLENGVVKTEVRPPTGFTAGKYKHYGGFHSNAVNYGDSSYGSKLEFLDIKDTNIKHRNSTETEPFTLQGAEGDRMDPRAERAKRVLSYKSAIEGSRALGTLKIDGIGKRG